MDPRTRHRYLIHNYARYYGGERFLRAFESQQESIRRSDMDVLRETYQFIRDEDEDEDDASWEKRLAVKYYNKLFKEYALADLSRFAEGKIGLRWRTEEEVVAGKGQFICGSKHCKETEGLHSYEINFSYEEKHEKKRCLVKIRVCPACALKLFHKKIQEAHVGANGHRGSEECTSNIRQGKSNKTTKKTRSRTNSTHSLLDQEQLDGKAKHINVTKHRNDGEQRKKTKRSHSSEMSSQKDTTQPQTNAGIHSWIESIRGKPVQNGSCSQSDNSEANPSDKASSSTGKDTTKTDNPAGSRFLGEQKIFSGLFL